MAGSTTTRQAVIVAAGFGSRLQALRPGGHLIKPLEPVGGVPILRRVIATTMAAGIEEVILVTGHMAVELEAAVASWGVGGKVRFVRNDRYDLGNGISLLCGARACAGDFVLLMSDHLFEAENLTGLLAAGRGGDGAVLAIDRKIESCFDLADATKVVVEGERILEIDKDLGHFNAIDTGMFLISGEVVQLLSAVVKRHGDASISEAMKEFIGEGRMGAYDVGSGRWHDVDTPEMFEEAERLIAAGIFSG